MLFVELFTIQTIKTTTTAAAWQLQFWRKSWRLTRVDHAIAPNTSSLLRKLACARLPSEIRCLFCSEICFALCTGNRVGKGMLRAAARGKRWLHYSSGRPDKPTAASIRWPQEIWKKNWTKFLSQNTLNYTLYTGRGTQQSPHSTIKQQLTRWQKVFRVTMRVTDDVIVVVCVVVADVVFLCCCWQVTKMNNSSPQKSKFHIINFNKYTYNIIQYSINWRVIQAAAKPSVRLPPATIMYSSMQMDSRRTALVKKWILFGEWVGWS